MSSDIDFTVTSWFLGNVHDVKLYFNTQCPPLPSPQKMLTSFMDDPKDDLTLLKITFLKRSIWIAQTPNPWCREPVLPTNCLDFSTKYVFLRFLYIFLGFYVVFRFNLNEFELTNYRSEERLSELGNCTDTKALDLNCSEAVPIVLLRL